MNIRSEQLLFLTRWVVCRANSLAQREFVIHFLSQQSRSVGIHRSHCLCFGEINKMILTIIIFFLVTVVVVFFGGGGLSPLPGVKNSDHLLFPIGKDAEHQTQDQHQHVDLGCVCAEGVSSEVPWLLQCLNKPSALRALGVRSSLLPIKDGPCH